MDNKLKLKKLNILTIGEQLNKAREEYNNLMEEYDTQLENELISMEYWEYGEMDAQDKTKYNYYCSEKLKAEKELISYCKEQFKNKGLLSDELKNLFNKASKNIILHDKLVKKLMEI